jgi:hypothetical protein
MKYENISYPICSQNFNMEAVFDVWAPQMPVASPFIEMANFTYGVSSDPFCFYKDMSKSNYIIEPVTANSVTIGVQKIDPYRVGNYFMLSPTLKTTILTLDETKADEDGPTNLVPSVQITLHEDYDEVINRIAKFANLNYNWDSYGAPQIKMDCIERGTNLLLEIVKLKQESKLDIPAPFAVPTPEGGIQLEWQNLHKYLEIKIRKDSSDMEFFASDESPEQEYELEGVFCSHGEWEEILYWLYSDTAGSLRMLFGKKAA